MIHRVAISAKAGSGKTTFADLLLCEAESRSIPGKVYSFAFAIKEISRNYYGIEKKDRRLLQTLGAKMKEVVDDFGKVHDDVFARYTCRLIQNDAVGIEDDYLQVVDDLRHKVELEMLRKIGFFVVRIETDVHVRARRLSKSVEEVLDEGQHISEVDLDDYRGWDMVFEDNQYGLDNLRAKAKEMIKALLLVA